MNQITFSERHKKRIKIDMLSVYRLSLSQHAVFTHWEKDCSPRTLSIFSINSFSKRMFFLVEVVRLSERGTLLALFSCIRVRTHDILDWCAPIYSKPLTQTMKEQQWKP